MFIIMTSLVFRTLNIFSYLILVHKRNWLFWFSIYILYLYLYLYLMMMRGARFCYPDLQILPVSPSPVYQKQGQPLYKVAAYFYQILNPIISKLQLRYYQILNPIISKLHRLAGYDRIYCQCRMQSDIAVYRQWYDLALIWLFVRLCIGWNRK